MPDKSSLTPRVFFVRHGETEWSKLGQFTSFAELDLTPEDIAQVSSAATVFVGEDKLINPSCIARVFVSPRRRAVTTSNLFFSSSRDIVTDKIIYSEDITEWNYGDYEGMRKEDIRRLRKGKGFDNAQDWEVWDGCEGGETVQPVTAPLDKLILQIKDIQAPHMHGATCADVVVVGPAIRCYPDVMLALRGLNSECTRLNMVLSIDVL